MTHTCHAHGCPTTVPPKLFMCRLHWYRVRAPLRALVWAHYRPGQERDKRPTPAYLAVTFTAIAELAQAADPVEAAVYHTRANELRHALVARGEPDPLRGVASLPAAG